VPERPEPEPEPPESESDEYRVVLREETRRPEPPPREASISSERDGVWFPRAVVVDSHGAVAESFRHIALRLRRELVRRHQRSVAVVSALRAEGKTTVACNLALALSSVARDREVALVDLDLRKPSVQRAFSLPNGPGFEDVLRGDRKLLEAGVSVERPPLDVFPARRPLAEAHELLVKPGFELAVRELERRYEIIVYDTPPTLLVPDAAIIVERIGAAVAVARSGRTARRGFEQTIELLTPERVIGCILNEGTASAQRTQYGYYGADPDGDEKP
jgi:Mrp family chromosome partitioning ATPase